MYRALLPLLLAGSLHAAEEKKIVAIYDLEDELSESGRSKASLLGMDMEATRPLTLFDITRSLTKAAAIRR